jgi:hypothetical protein
MSVHHEGAPQQRSARIRATLVLLSLALLAPGCASKGGAKAAQTKEATVSTAQAKEPEHIRVQHILIGFKGSVPGKNITRTVEEAKAIAYGLVDSAKAGVNYDDLVARHTDDSAPGIYGLANKGAVSAGPPKEYPRENMVPAFGDVGFKLQVGEIGVADYDARTSPYGYHVIKRVE